MLCALSSQCLCLGRHPDVRRSGSRSVPQFRPGYTSVYNVYRSETHTLSCLFLPLLMTHSLAFILPRCHLAQSFQLLAQASVQTMRQKWRLRLSCRLLAVPVLCCVVLLCLDFLEQVEWLFKGCDPTSSGTLAEQAFATVVQALAVQTRLPDGG